MKNKENDWNLLFNNFKIQKVEFLPDIIKYRMEYFKFSKVINYSTIMYSDTTPIALMPIFVMPNKNNKICNFAPKNLPAPLFEDKNKKKRFQIYSEYLDLIKSIKKKHKIKKIYFDIDCQYVNDVEFMSFLLEQKFKVESSKTIIVVGNSHTGREINKDYRKSYKSLINSNIKKYDLQVLDNNNFKIEIWEKFKQMHLKVSGKKTRSDSTWELQKQSLLNQNAVVIYVKKEEKYLGFAYFFTTKTNALYASAAHDIQENKKIPIGHLIQDFAITYFSKKKIINYYLGFNENKKTIKSKKDKNLALFQKGFANRYSVLLTLSK